MMRKCLTIASILIILTCCTLPYLCRGAAEPFPMTPSTSFSTARPDAQAIMESLQKFPSLQDVAYPPPAEDLTNKYLTSLYTINNAFMKKVILALSAFQQEHGVEKCNFISLAKNYDSLQDTIAHSANVSKFYVRLYISRAIAWHVRTTESPLEAVEKIKVCKDFWDEKQLYILLSLLSVEDIFLGGLSSIQASMTKIAFYNSKSADFFWRPNPITRMTLRRINDEHLLCRTTYVSTAEQQVVLNGYYDKVFGNQAFLTDERALTKLLTDVNKLSMKPDLCLRKLAFYYLCQIYDLFTLDHCGKMDMTFVPVNLALQKSASWSIPSEEKFTLRQISNLIDALSGPSTSMPPRELLKSRSEQHKRHTCSTLLEIFLDYHGLSLLSKMPQLFRLIEDSISIFYDEHMKEFGSQPTDPPMSADAESDAMFQLIKFRKMHGHDILKLLSRINLFFDEYAPAYIVLESAFGDEFFLYEGMPIYAFFSLPNNVIQRERTASVVSEFCKNLVNQPEHNQKTVDDLMKIYFPPESPQQKNTPPAQQTKKSKKGKKKGCKDVVPQKQPSFSGDEAQEQDKGVHRSSTILAESHEAKEVKSIVLRYHPRVLRWFQLKFSAQKSLASVLYHTLPPAIDIYLEKEGIKDLWKGKFDRYRLPAKITLKDGTYMYVICCCAITHDGLMIYHHGNDPSSPEEIKQIFNIVVPEESSAQKDDEEDPFIVHFQKKKLTSRSLVLDDNDRFVMFYDPVNELYVQLFHNPAAKR